jgi:flagellar protein FliO/FliZ
MFKTLFILGLLGGAFYYIFRFLSKKAGIQFLGGDVVTVLSVVPIGQNRYLQIIDLAGRVLVLGISDSSINLITEITDRDEIDRIRIKSQTRVPARQGGFQEYLTRGIGRIVDLVNERRGRGRADRSVEGFGQGVDLDYLHRQRNRLKKMNGIDNE